jgi:ribonuclease P protein component
MQTIRSSREIDAMFRSGAKIDGPLMMLLISSSADATVEGRACFVAGRRLGGAVLRNRAKRVMREALRLSGGPPRGLDIVLIARSAVITAKMPDVEHALHDLLARARASL